MARLAISIAILSFSASACEGNAENLAYDCGADVIELFAEGHPETIALYERSEAEFGAKWLERIRCLAEHGDAESQLKLGIVYRDGSDGPPQNHAEAAVWFRRAAEQGHPMAQYNLARLYENGRGVPRDLIMAYVWYNLASSGFDSWDDSHTMATARRDQVASQLTTVDLRKAHQLASEWSVKRP